MGAPLQSRSENEAPRQGVGPLNARPAATFPGAPKENLPIFHPPIAASPEKISATSDFHPTITASPGSTGSNEFAPVMPATLAPGTPSAIETAHAASAGEIVKPGQYHPGYAKQILAYFDRPKTRRVIDSYTWKSGAVSDKERFVPNTPPHFSEFARSIGVTTRKLKSWAKDHPEFKEAMEQCQEILEEFLIDNGLLGVYGSQAMIFVAKNKTKMKDKVIHENQHVDMNKVLDQIAEGKVRPGGMLDMPESDE